MQRHGKLEGRKPKGSFVHIACQVQHHDKLDGLEPKGNTVNVGYNDA